MNISAIDTHDPAGMANWLRTRAVAMREFATLSDEAQIRQFLAQWQKNVLPHYALRMDQSAAMIERLAGSGECICTMCGLRHGGYKIDGGF